MKKLKYLILGILLAIGLPVLAVNITVPSAPGLGYWLTSTTTGQYVASSTSPIYVGGVVATTSGSAASPAIQVGNGTGLYNAGGTSLGFGASSANIQWDGGELFPGSNGTKNLGIDSTNVWNKIFVKYASTTALSTTGNFWLNTSGYPQGIIGAYDASPIANVEINGIGQGPYTSWGLKNDGGSGALTYDTATSLGGISPNLILNNLTGGGTCFLIKLGSNNGSACLRTYNSLSSIFNVISPYNVSGTEANLSTTMVNSDGGNNTLDIGLEDYPGSSPTGKQMYLHALANAYTTQMPTMSFGWWNQGFGPSSNATSSWGWLVASTTYTGSVGTTSVVALGDVWTNGYAKATGLDYGVQGVGDGTGATVQLVSSTTRTKALEVFKRSGTAFTSLFSVLNSGIASTSNLLISTKANCSGTSALTTDSTGNVVCGAITGSGGSGFSTTSADYHITATTTLPSITTMVNLGAIKNTLSGLIAGINGVLYNVATTTASCLGTVSCTDFTILGNTPITISGSGGGGGAFPFSADTNFGQVVYSTSTPTLWLKSGIFASSTSQFTNTVAINSTTTSATTTALNISGNLTIGTTGAIPTGSANNGITVGGTGSFGSNVWITPQSRGLFFNSVGTFAPGFQRDTSNNIQFIGTSNNAVSYGYLVGQGWWGFGSSSPAARVAIQANPSDFAFNRNLFQIGSSTASGTTTLFNIDNVGNITTQLGSGFVKSTGAGSALSIDTNTYLTGNQTITLSGAITGSGATAITTSFGNLAQGVLGNTGAAAGVPTALATSTLYSTGTPGQVLSWNNGVPQWVATTTFTQGTGITLSTAGNALTITNAGVTSNVAGNGISVSGATGAVTITNTIGYPFPSNATSTLLTFSGGLLSVGSTTINGNATTTGTFYAAIASSTNLYGAGLATCTGTQFLQWSAGSFGCATPAGSGTPGGSNGQIQFNDGSSFGGWANSFINKTLGVLGIGTTTPRWLLQLASSTAPQLALTSSSASGNFHWTFNNVFGNLFLATSSDSTFATSTYANPNIGFIEFPANGGCIGCTDILLANGINLRNAKYIAATSTEFVASTTQIIYTAPSGRKAFIQGATAFNQSGSTITASAFIVTGGAYYALGTTTIATGFSGQVLGQNNAVVLDPGESIAVDTGTSVQKVSAILTGIEFDASVPFFSKKVFNLAAGTTTVYTAPPGVSAAVVSGVAGITSGCINLANVSASTVQVYGYRVPSGSIPINTLNGIINAISIPANGMNCNNLPIAGLGVTLNSGDYIAIGLVSGKLLIGWANIIEH